MRGRIGTVSLLALLALLLAGGEARAHRLKADCFVRPGWRIQVESWFETGDSPRSARVQVFRPDGQLLTEGRLNSDGIFVFAFTEVESLRVVVSAGDGHRAETTVPAATLARYAVCSAVACLSPEPTSVLCVPAVLPLPGSTAAGPPAAVVKRNPPPEEGGSSPFSPEGPLADRSSPFPFKDVLIGVGFLLAVAAFVLSWRNAQELRHLRQQSQAKPKPD
jgi:nickel transport protein